MLWKLDSSWLMMAIATVSVLSYFFGSALNWLKREDGFGAFGNAIIIAGRFFVTILAADYRGYNLHELHFAIAIGLTGAFVLLTSLTLARSLVKRM
jgi:hypothetical protein